MNEYRILVVDDEPTNLRLLTQLLEQEGYKVRLATSGERAFAIIEKEKPDLVLLDVNMPVMNGFEVCKKLKDQPETHDIPVLFVSALHQTAEKVQGFAVGGVDYITKPFQTVEVLARVKTHLTLRDIQKEMETFNKYLEKKVHDRTALLRQALHDAKQNQAQIQAVFDHMVDGVVVANNRGIIQSINPAMEKIFGYAKPEMIGQNVAILMPTEHQIEHSNYIKNYREAGQTVYQVMGNERELQGQHKNGSLIPIMITLSDFEFEEERMITAVIRDMTVVRRAEQERLKSIAIEQELLTAQQVQKTLLPPANPRWAKLEAICFSHSAREVGGDFYAYQAIEQPFTLNSQTIDGRYVVAIGDVSGKGVSAALLMSVSLALFQVALQQTASPQALLSYLDGTLQPYTQPRRQNCALTCVEINPIEPDGTFLIRVVNGGGIPAYIKRRVGLVEHPEIVGFALGQGLEEQSEYQQLEFTLTAGDMIILVSDGVVEAHNRIGQMVGFERLHQLIQNGPLDSATAMLEYLKRQISAFTGGAEQLDDMTMVVVKL